MARVKHVLEIAMVNKSAPKKRNVSKTTFKKKPKHSITRETKKNTVEKKFFDLGVAALAATGANTWSAVQLLNQVRLGTGASNRIGRKLNMTSIALRVRQDVTGVPGMGAFRTLVVYDNNPQAAVPAITDILASDNNISMPNLLNSDRFVTLIDEIQHSDGFNTASGNAGLLTDNMYRKIGLTAEFKADAGAIGDFSKGAIYAAISSVDGNVGVTTHSFLSRIRYTDL